MNNARVCRELRNGDLNKNIVCGANGERVEFVIYTTVTINKGRPLRLSQAWRKRVSRANVSAQFSDVGTQLHAAPPRRAQPVPDLIWIIYLSLSRQLLLAYWRKLLFY